MHAGSDEWFAPVYIGIKSSCGQKFSILAVVANEKCQNKFENYIKVGKRTRKWLGIETLPEGAFIYKNITVIRKKRTVFSVKSFRHM